MKTFVRKIAENLGTYLVSISKGVESEKQAEKQIPSFEEIFPVSLEECLNHLIDDDNKSKKATKKAMKEECLKTSAVKQTAMTINYGKSRTGLEDWFATGKTFTAKYDGWNTSRTRIFLIGSGAMSEKQFKKELRAFIKAELDGFKMGGRIEGF